MDARSVIEGDSNDTRDKYGRRERSVMSHLAQVLRNYRDTVRTRRAVSKAINRAGNPTVETELLAMAQHQGVRL